MIYAIGYAVIVLTCTLVMVSMTRRSPTIARAYWCIAIVSAYVIMSMVLWLQLLSLLDLREPLWIIGLALLLIMTIIIGAFPPAKSTESGSRKLWSTAASIRRTYRSMTGVSQ